MRSMWGVLALSAGCFAGGGDDDGGDGDPPPPPVVSSMSPTSGPYGTDIVIEGENFGAGDMGGLSFAAPSSPRGFASIGIDEWTDTRIRVRYPFPAEGAIDVAVGGQSAPAGSFAPEVAWDPGPGSEGWGEVLAARVLSGGAVAAIHSHFAFVGGQNPRLVLFEGESAADHELPGLPEEPGQIVLFEAADGRAEVLANAGPSLEVTHFAWNGEVLEAMATGVHGSLLAGGLDGDGVFAWVQQESEVVRVRADDDWTPDRTIAAVGFLAGDVTSDGTLVAVYPEQTGQVTDYEASPRLAWLLPAASAFSNEEEVEGTSYDDSIPRMSVRVAPDGQRAVVEWCVSEDSNVGCGYRRLRDAGGTWSWLPEIGAEQGLDYDVEVAFTATGFAAAYSYGRDDGIALVPDLGAPDQQQVIPVYPAAVGALLGTDSGLRLLVEADAISYAPQPR